MDLFALFPFAALAVLASLVVLTFASREEPSRSRNAQLVVAMIVLGVIVTTYAAVFTFFFVAALAWSSQSEPLAVLSVALSAVIVIAGVVLTAQGARRVRGTHLHGAADSPV